MPLRPSKSGAHAPTQRGGMVLCVDDEAVVLNSLRRQLREVCPDHAIKVVRSAEAALKVLEDARERGRPVPLLISDQLMPGMTGDEPSSAWRSSTRTPTRSCSRGRPLQLHRARREL